MENFQQELLWFLIRGIRLMIYLAKSLIIMFQTYPPTPAPESPFNVEDGRSTLVMRAISGPS